MILRIELIKFIEWRSLSYEASFFFETRIIFGQLILSRFAMPK